MTITTTLTLVLVLLTCPSSMAEERCSTRAIGNSNEVMLSAMCNTNSATIQWSNGNEPVEYVILRYSCHGYNGDNTTSSEMNVEISPQVVDYSLVNNDADFVSTTIVPAGTWSECSYYGCYRKLGIGIYFPFTTQSCRWPITAISTLNGASTSTASVHVYSGSPSPTHLSSSTNSESESLKYSQLAGSSSSMTIDGGIDEPSNFRGGFGLNEVGITVSAVFVVMAVIIVLGLVVIIKRIRYKKWIESFKDEVKLDPYASLVSITAPAHYTSTVSLDSHIDHLNFEAISSKTKMEHDAVITEDIDCDSVTNRSLHAVTPIELDNVEMDTSMQALGWEEEMDPTSRVEPGVMNSDYNMAGTANATSGNCAVITERAVDKCAPGYLDSSYFVS